MFKMFRIPPLGQAVSLKYSTYNVTSMEVDETSDEDHENDDIIIDEHHQQDPSITALSDSGIQGKRHLLTRTQHGNIILTNRQG